MRRVGNDAMQSVSDALRMETKRAGARLVTHSPVAVDHVEAVGPASVGALCEIVERVDHSRELDSQFHDAKLTDLAAFVKALRTREYDMVVQIVGILPDVARVRFADVHNVEVDPVAVLLVKLVESGNLPPEGRSGITAEDEYHRFIAAQGR